jgi:hypothetical protein
MQCSYRSASRTVAGPAANVSSTAAGPGNRKAYSAVRSNPMYSAASSGFANMIVRSSSWIMRP